MDYLVWGEEYLREAEHLRERERLGKVMRYSFSRLEPSNKPLPEED